MKHWTTILAGTGLVATMAAQAGRIPSDHIVGHYGTNVVYHIAHAKTRVDYQGPIYLRGEFVEFLDAGYFFLAEDSKYIKVHYEQNQLPGPLTKEDKLLVLGEVKQQLGSRNHLEAQAIYRWVDVASNFVPAVQAGR